jgi:hypothetical protein
MHRGESLMETNGWWNEKEKVEKGEVRLSGIGEAKVRKRLEKEIQNDKDVL